MKKFMVILLTLVMTLSVLQTSAFAATISSSQVEKAIEWAEAKKATGTKSYSNWCLKFVSDAYRAAGVSAQSFGYASAAANAMVKHYDQNPPRGAIVFWDWYGTLDGVYRNWGHVGISLGNGKVIHADYNGIKVTSLNFDSTRKYRGWGTWCNNTMEQENTASSKPSQGITEGVYIIQCMLGGNLNIYAGLDRDYTNACIWENDGSKEQKFRITHVGGNKYTIAPLSSGNGYSRVLDVFRGSSINLPLRYNLNVDIYRPKDRPAQEWYIKDIGNNCYKIELAALKDGVLTSAGSRNNSNVSLQKYTGAISQQWKFIRQ